MAFKKPLESKQQAVNPELMAAVAKVLSHNHIGEWGSDHTQESKSLGGWNYLAIAAIGRQAARAHAYVYQGAGKRLAQDGNAPLATNSLTAKLVLQPNGAQSGALFQWEYIQQMHLHGACMIFNRPSLDGTRTAARYIIPLALTMPVYPGQDQRCPEGGIRILPYQAGLGWYSNPFLSYLTGATVSINAVSIIRYPHAYLRGDGQSPTDAAGWWIDQATMIDMSRWKQLKRGPRPHGVISVDDDGVTDAELDAIEKRVNRKLGDGEYDERAIAIGAKVNLQSDNSPVDMDYVAAFDQLGKSILALHGANPAMVGLIENLTYGGNAAAQQLGLTVVQSDLDLLAGEWTKLARDEGEAVTVEYEVQPFDDPTLVEQQLAADVDAGMILGKEYRARRGLPPFGDWRDNARVTSSGLVDDREPPSAKQPAPAPTAPEPMFRSLDTWAKELKVMGKTKSLINDQQRYAPYTPYRRPVVAFDLDSTLAEYDGYDEDYIGNPIPAGIEAAQRVKAAGCQVVIFTCRDNDALVSAWLDAAGVPWDSINCNPDGSTGSGKVFADVYYDDKAVNVAEGVEAIARLLPDCEAKDKLLRKQDDRKLGCVMLEAPPRVCQMVKDIQDQIPPIQLVGDGYESWPHVTLLYGIVGTPIEDVIAMVRKFAPVDATFGRVSTFENPDGSVLKVEVDSPALHKLNAMLKSAFPVEETFPDYRPHLTLAYMDAEAAPSYTGSSPLSGMTTTFTHAVVSIDGKKIRVPLGAPIEPPASLPPVAPVAMSKSITFADADESIRISTLSEMESKFRSFEAKLEQWNRQSESKIAEQFESLAKAIAMPKADVELVANPPTPEVIADTPKGPEAAGLAIYAQDTGRVLMLQRAITDHDPASGMWEFPGGHLEPEEEPLEAAKREWMEETGHIIPRGELVGQWDSGIYRGHVWSIPSESRIRLNLDADQRHVLNPDDPDGDQIEVIAWWEPTQLIDNPAVRKELSDSIDMVLEVIPKRETDWGQRLSNLQERRDPEGITEEAAISD